MRLFCLAFAGLLEEITLDYPEVVETVQRALKFADAKPVYLPVESYIDTILAELEKLENENNKISPSIRRYTIIINEVYSFNIVSHDSLFVVREM